MEQPARAGGRRAWPPADPLTDPALATRPRTLGARASRALAGLLGTDPAAAFGPARPVADPGNAAGPLAAVHAQGTAGLLTGLAVPGVAARQRPGHAAEPAGRGPGRGGGRDAARGRGPGPGGGQDRRAARQPGGRGGSPGRRRSAGAPAGPAPRPPRPGPVVGAADEPRAARTGQPGDRPGMRWTS